MLFLKILTHTPFWAFLIFFWLIFIGIRATNNRKIHLNSLLITPATFLFFYIYNLKKIDSWNLLLLSAALTFSSIVLTYFFKNESIIFNEDESFTREGSHSTLICGMITFFVRYFCEYKKATIGDPHLALELISSGIIGGFSVGRNLKFFVRAKKIKRRKL